MLILELLAPFIHQGIRYTQRSAPRARNFVSKGISFDQRLIEMSRVIGQGGSWKHGGCDGWCHSFSTCCWVSWCWPCAISKARSDYDGSSCLFNFFCMPACGIRNLIRLNYGIHGSPCGDIACSMCTPCCSSAQIIHEMRDRYSDKLAKLGPMAMKQ